MIDLDRIKKSLIKNKGGTEIVATDELVAIIDRAIEAEAKVAKQERQLELAEGFAGSFFDKTYEESKKIALLEKALKLLADKIVWGWREQCPDWSPTCGGKMLWCDGETAINCIVKRTLEKASESSG